MFRSSINGPNDIEVINLDFITRSMTSQGFSFHKQKNLDLEAGFCITSFAIEKKNQLMTALDKNLFVCAGYYKGKLLQQKQVKYQTDIPFTFQAIFENIKYRAEDELFQFDSEIQKIRNISEDTQQKIKNYANFSQQMKTTEVYERIKNLQKLSYQKIIADTSKLLQDKKKIDAKNQGLIDSLLRIQGHKQALQTTILSYQQENQYLQNVKQRIDDQIDLKKSVGIQLTIHNLNEITFTQYLKNLTAIKQLQLKKKCLIE